MDWKQKMEELPFGYSELIYHGQKYSLTKTEYIGGKSIKVFAKELGGNRFISFNYYFTSGSNLLKPCEMPEQEVINFLEGAELI